MIILEPLKSVSLSHRALHVAAAASGEIVALSKEGVGTLIGPNRSAARALEFDGQVTGVALAPDGDLLAVLEDEFLSLIELPTLTKTLRLACAFEAALFSHSGKFLWSAFHIQGAKAVLEVLDTTNWGLVAKAEVPDPFENSALMLFAHPAEERVVLWVAGGQDGQCLYWGHFAGSRVALKRFPELTNTTPPCFDRAGKRFLVVSDGAVRLYQFPKGPELGRIQWQLADDPPAESIAFVGEERALVHSGNGRLFLIDLKCLQIVEEIQISGHEPRPAYELYPNLYPDGDLCSDLSTFLPLPSGEFLSIHRQLPRESTLDWRDEILVWKFPYS
jgi:hypothetical protein